MWMDGVPAGRTSDGGDPPRRRKRGGRTQASNLAFPRRAAATSLAPGRKWPAPERRWTEGRGRREERRREGAGGRGRRRRDEPKQQATRVMADIAVGSGRRRKERKGRSKDGGRENAPERVLAPESFGRRQEETPRGPSGEARNRSSAWRGSIPGLLPGRRSG